MTVIAVDTETTGVAYFDTPFCVTVAAYNDQEELESMFLDLDDPVQAAEVKTLLSEADELVFHNAKFDMQKLALVGLFVPDERDPLTVHDTEAIAHLLDENRPKRLKALAKSVLGEETDEAEAIRAAKKEVGLRAKDGYHLLPREVVVPYALKDAEFTLRLWHELYPKLAEHDDLLGIYSTEQRLCFVLLEMERNGMALDLEYVESTAKAYAGKALKLEMDIRDFVGSEEFNPNSPKQVTEAFLALGYELESTSKESLREINHPLAEKLLELRTTKKMHGTYLKPMLEEQRDGVIHPNFRQHGAKTGRMSSGGAEA
jgi:DNA polymerase-1